MITTLKVLVLTVCFLLLSVTAIIAQDFCEGNFDYDDDQDGTDAFTFKTDFGRSSFGNPCPPDGPAPVEKTGQTSSYHLGDDGDFERGIEWPNPRFTDNGDGTVTDNLTGLIWLRDANCSLINGPRTWEDALNIIVPQLADGYCGLTDGSEVGDWRLPNVKELQSLIDFGESIPALPSGHPFTNVLGSRYWSSTSTAGYTHYAWEVEMRYGYVSDGNKVDSNYVWPVRGGQ